MNLEQNLSDVSNRPSSLISLFPDLETNSAVKNVSEKTIEEKEEKEKNSLEEITKETNPEIEIENLREQYGLLEEQNILGLDYESLFSYLEHQMNPEEVYSQEESKEGSKHHYVMSDEEARETVEKIEISYQLGSKEDVPYEKREAFSKWQEFNKTLLMLYHTLSPIKSDNVDYARLN